MRRRRVTLREATLLLMCLAAIGNFAYLFARLSADEQLLRTQSPLLLPHHHQHSHQQLSPRQATVQPSAANCTAGGGGGGARRRDRAVPASQAQTACDSEVGWGLVARLQARRQTVCDGAAPGASRLECFEHRGAHSHAPASAYCDMERVALSGAAISAGLQGHLTYRPGALALAGCPGASQRLAHVPFAAPYAELFSRGVSEQLPRCDAWVEEPVLALTRLEWAPLLLSSCCDALNALVGVHVAGVDPANVRVLLLDALPEGGPFEGFFAALSRGGPLLHARQLFVDGSRTVCFRRLVTSVPGHSSFLLDNAQGRGAACRASELLLSFRNTVLLHFDLLDSRRAQEDDAAVDVTFVSRRPYLNKKTISRVVVNEDELVHAMQSHAEQVNFAVRDFAAMALPEQLRAARGTDILVGMHGAGLVHSIFLADDAAVVEFWPGGFGENNRHRNIALLAGHVYLGYELASRETDHIHLDVQQFVQSIETAVRVAHGSFGTSVRRCGLLNCTTR